MISEDFIKVWNESKSIKEAATTLDMEYGQVRRVAASLRQLGYNLKKYSAGRKKNEQV